MSEALHQASAVIESARVEATHRPLVDLVLAAIRRAIALLDAENASSPDTAEAWREEADAPRLYDEALHRLHERRLHALDLNDDVVQRLVVAKLALDLGRREQSEEALVGALDAARSIIAELLAGAEGEVRLSPDELRRGPESRVAHCE